MRNRVAKQFNEGMPSVGSSTSSSTPCVSARSGGYESSHRSGKRHLPDPATQRLVTPSRRRLVSTDLARQEVIRSMPRCESVPVIPSIAEIGWSPSNNTSRHGRYSLVQTDSNGFTPLKIRGGECAARFAARTFTSSIDNWTGSAAATQSDTPRSVRGSSVVRSFSDRNRLSRVPIGSRITSPKSTVSTPRGCGGQSLSSSRELLAALGGDTLPSIPVSPATPRSTAESSFAHRGRIGSTLLREYTPTRLNWGGSCFYRKGGIMTARPPPKAWNAGLGRKLFT